jgi:hypothetical protein
MAEILRSTTTHPVPRKDSAAAINERRLPAERVYALAGWSDREVELLPRLDRDPQALLREVAAIPLGD